MKTISYFSCCFHSCWAIAQVSLPSFFKGLPGTSFFKTRFLVKSFRKDSDFFLNLYLCFARISPKLHWDQSNLSVITFDSNFALAPAIQQQPLFRKENRKLCLLDINMCILYVQDQKGEKGRFHQHFLKNEGLTFNTCGLSTCVIMCDVLLMNHTLGVYVWTVLDCHWTSFYRSYLHHTLFAKRWEYDLSKHHKIRAQFSFWSWLHL